jgi:hypothetical protein
MIAVQVKRDDGTWITIHKYPEHSADIAEIRKEQLERNDTAGTYRTRMV